MTDFQQVTRKKWLARRCLQRPRQCSDFFEQIAVEIPKFVERFERLCEEMTTKDYFMQAMSVVENSSKKLQHIVCLGLGPFSRTFQSLHQLAFICATQRYLNIPTSSFFDPVFNAAEKEILQNLNYKIMHENCEGKYIAEVATLFYLPHCPKSLTNNLLWSNWQPLHLANACIINNSFDSLIRNKPKRLLKQDASYILKIQDFVREQALYDDYEIRNIFNDLSVHTFPLHTLPADNHEMWKPLEAPIYEHDNDEFIKT